MTRQRGLQAGIFVFLILTVARRRTRSSTWRALSPVIENLRSAPEPPVRGDANTLTAIVKNPRGYASGITGARARGPCPTRPGRAS